MSRSKWKGPYINTNCNILNMIKKQQLDDSFLATRDSTIIPAFVGNTFKIYNGKSYIEITVDENMIGHKFGEFSPTRARFVFVKKKKSKR